MMFNDDYDRFLSLNPIIEYYGLQGGNEEPQSPGRPATSESHSRQAGIDICINITSKVKENNYTHPKTNWYRDNNCFVNT